MGGKRLQNLGSLAENPPLHSALALRRRPTAYLFPGRQGACALRSPSSSSRARGPFLLACWAAREQGEDRHHHRRLGGQERRGCVRYGRAAPFHSALLPEEPRSCPHGASEGSVAGRDRKGRRSPTGRPASAAGSQGRWWFDQLARPDLPPPQTTSRPRVSTSRNGFE